MKCKLCLEEKELIKKSHILPSFIYNGLFDDKHRLVSLNINDFNDKSYHQTGYHEGGILCADCDNGILGGLERYASNTIYAEESKNGVHRKYHSGQGEVLPVLRFSNLNYTKLKLFFLSLLWKSHISKLNFFSQIDLGSKYGEKIRKMILNQYAGKEDEFEVVLIKIETDGTRPN
ncbi:hypothetical protein [Sphingobacterium sp.]|uniref:hypothetical protein n=1 Tax=Sphingobacterium sp. TaxID=341027 RepID=UPI00258B0AAA|nr:hypothetical protein [Sphingobacterium sp.]WET69724.1 MAG: hypothetical protein P0Y57_01285 [Sphingobacterium sp.]